VLKVGDRTEWPVLVVELGALAERARVNDDNVERTGAERFFVACLELGNVTKVERPELGEVHLD
jgi:hypothetical protein